MSQEQESEVVEKTTEVPDEDIKRAERQGWTDKEVWKESGKDPEKWVDAKTFLERGENTLPILRANYKKLEEKLDKQSETFEKFVKFQEEKEERIRKESYEKALDDVRKEQAKAFEEGDQEAFRRAQAREDDIRKRKEAEKPKETGEDPEFRTWVSENPWYFDDEDCNALANGIGERLAQTHAHLSKRQFFDEVKSRVKKAMPHKFENPNRAKAAAVEGTGNATSRKQKGKTYSDLPAEFKKACDEFVKTIPGYTKEQYLKDVDWSNIQ